jgi:membrane-associated protein
MLDVLRGLVDLFLHLDKHLTQIVSQYGFWTYLLLFLIIFCETGLVVTPFLPGDSLLFAAGALAAGGSMNIFLLVVLLIVAAILGDTVNYWIGGLVGPQAFSGKLPLLKHEHLTRTHAFYERHGGKTIIFARFIPIIRTFAPFVAGIGSMSYRHFLSYNVVGGVVWVVLFLVSGYFFGNLPLVKENFSLVVMAIIVISVLPAVYEFVRNRMQAQPGGGGAA